MAVYSNFKYEAFANRFNATLFDEVTNVIQKMNQKAENEIRKQNERFFSMFSNSIVNKAGPPALGSFTPVWQKLSNLYSAYKGHSNFYFREGDLGKDLKDLEVEDVFGEPLVMAISGRMGVGMSYRSEREGRRHRSMRTGRFVTRSEAQEFFPGYINVYPFSDIREEPSHDVLAYALPDELIAFKLANYRGRYYRPALLPFFQWWIHYKSLEIIKRVYST